MGHALGAVWVTPSGAVGARLPVLSVPLGSARLTCRRQRWDACGACFVTPSPPAGGGGCRASCGCLVGGRRRLPGGFAVAVTVGPGDGLPLLWQGRPAGGGGAACRASRWSGGESRWGLAGRGRRRLTGRWARPPRLSGGSAAEWGRLCGPGPTPRSGVRRAHPDQGQPRGGHPVLDPNHHTERRRGPGMGAGRGGGRADGVVLAIFCLALVWHRLSVGLHSVFH